MGELEPLILPLGVKDGMSSGLRAPLRSVNLFRGALVSLQGVLVGFSLHSLIREAASFETAFAGVRKTVNATNAEFGVLRQGIRDLAKEMPTARNEIAAVAQAAGQLGVSNRNLLSFTATAIKLGEATNLSADDAATGLARFDAAMQQDISNAEALGSVLVALGNNFATTESEILSISQRMAGAGKAIGLLPGQVLALGASLKTVGVEAELGGTALQQLMFKMAGAAAGVGDGADKLDVFASVMGTTAEQARLLIQSDPAQALEALAQGFDAIQKTQGAGGAIRALDDLGLEGQRVISVVLGLANANKELGRAFGIAADQMARPSALTQEYGQRLKTFDAQVAILKNQVHDIALTLGEELLPVAKEIVAALQSMTLGWDDASNAMFKHAAGFANVAVAYSQAVMKLGETINVSLTGAWHNFNLQVAYGLERIGGASAEEALRSFDQAMLGFDRNTQSYAKSVESNFDGLRKAIEDWRLEHTIPPKVLQDLDDVARAAYTTAAALGRLAASTSGGGAGQLAADLDIALGRLQAATERQRELFDLTTTDELARVEYHGGLDLRLLVAQRGALEAQIAKLREEGGAEEQISKLGFGIYEINEQILHVEEKRRLEGEGILDAYAKQTKELKAQAAERLSGQNQRLFDQGISGLSGGPFGNTLGQVSQMAKGYQLALDEQKKFRDQYEAGLITLEQLDAASAKNRLAITSQLFGSLGSALDDYMEATGNRSKEMLVARKAIAIAEATINTALAATMALAELGPIAGPAFAAVIAGLGMAQVALIAATPTYHTGGLVTGRDARLGPGEVQATLQTGEYVVSRRGVEALDRINRGDATSSDTGRSGGSSRQVQTVVILPEEALAEAARTSSTLRRTIAQIANGEA